MIGKRPQDPEDLVEEGELLLTINIFYPVIFQKVSDSQDSILTKLGQHNSPIPGWGLGL